MGFVPRPCLIRMGSSVYFPRLSSAGNNMGKCSGFYVTRSWYTPEESQFPCRSQLSVLFDSPLFVNDTHQADT